MEELAASKAERRGYDIEEKMEERKKLKQSEMKRRKNGRVFICVFSQL